MPAYCSMQSCSPLKNSAREDQRQTSSLLTTYKMHTMANHHRGAGCPLDRGLDILEGDPEHADINNESTHSLDATVALGGPEAVGHP